ncbi:MAG: hypothetical protein KTR35_13590 [Gammaproteobacteria bacterium]|nr:hypothetical protein [Gammaproteobacteria bacterium]
MDRLDRNDGLSVGRWKTPVRWSVCIWFVIALETLGELQHVLIEQLSLQSGMPSQAGAGHGELETPPA